MSQIKNLVESLLAEEVGNLGVQSYPTTFIQTDTGVETVEEKANLETFVITQNGKQVWEGSAKDKKDAINKAVAEGLEDEVTNGKVVVTLKKEMNENEESITLSPKSFRTLYNCYIAECMINESVDIDNTLEENGLITEGKITPKGKEWLKKYLPTIFAS